MGYYAHMSMISSLREQNFFKIKLLIQLNVSSQSGQKTLLHLSIKVQILVNLIWKS